MNLLQKTLLTILFVMIPFVVSAQFKVLTDISERPLDMDARANFPLPDRSSSRRGDVCAIIKVATTDMGFNFDLGSTLMVAKVEKKPEQAEIWLWVPVGTRQMKISHPRYGMLDTPSGFYDFRMQVKSGTVYTMRLHTEYSSDEDITTNDKIFRPVEFTVFPYDAKVELRKMPLKTDEKGFLSQEVPLGKYHYRVSADRYHYYDGTFELTEDMTTLPIKVRLHQAWGWLTLDKKFNVAGAVITIDGSVRRNISRLELNSGRHTVRVEAPNYEAMEQTIDIQDSAELVYMPSLTPILGSIKVTSSPSGATVTVDGKKIGVTPINVPEKIITGNHKVQLSLTNYRTEERDVTIVKGETSNLNVTLYDIAKYRFTSKPEGAKLYIDGKDKGRTPCNVELATGTYDVRLVEDKYKDYHHKMMLRSSEPDVTINMKRQYQQKTQFYVAPAFQVGNTAVGASLGTYLYNFNIEAFFMMGMSSEDIYWNYVGELENMPVKETFKPMFVGARLGYGIVAGTRWRITPQMGMGIAMISGDDSKCNASSLSIGCKVDYALFNHFGLTLTPEYNINISKSELMKELAPISSTMNGWAGGFNFRLGLYVFF